MKSKGFFFQYNKYILKDKRTYYIVNISEGFLLAFIVSRIVGADDRDSLLLIFITVALAPVGIWFAGGYKKIKESFLKRHNLEENELG